MNSLHAEIHIIIVAGCGFIQHTVYIEEAVSYHKLLTTIMLRIRGTLPLLLFHLCVSCQISQHLIPEQQSFWSGFLSAATDGGDN